MELKTNNKTIILNPTTKKIIKLTKEYKEKNLHNLFFKMVNENDIEVLVNIINALAELEDGTKAFQNTDEVCDFIDEYNKENNRAYEDIFKEMAEFINEMGFFNKKMSKKELEEQMKNPLATINMTDMMNDAIKSTVGETIKEEFKGYLG